MTTLFETYLKDIGLSEIEYEAVNALFKACFEQIANDKNPKRNGSINRRPSLIGAKQVGFDNKEWFPNKTLPDDMVEKAVNSQVGYRMGCWGGPGRTVLGKSSALSTENICASTSTGEGA